MRRRLRLLAALCGLCGLVGAPAGAAPPPASASRSLELAVREIDRCCGGRAERASLDARRRWSNALWRVVVAAQGRPGWAPVGAGPALAKQALRLDPGEVARLAIHPPDWLRERAAPAAGLVAPAAARLADLDRFGEAVFVLGSLELGVEQAARERDRRIEQARRDYAAAEQDAETEAATARAALAAAGADGRPFDFTAAFAERRRQIDDRVAERARQADALREEAYDLQAALAARSEELSASGSGEYLGALTDYRNRIVEINDRILQIGEEIARLTRLRGWLAAGAAAGDIEQQARPPAAAPPRR